MAPTTDPPNLKSACLMRPVLNAMAFGGVDTGRNSAQEAQRPITTGNIRGLGPAQSTAIGIRIVAVAVLLIILEKTTVANAKTAVNSQKFIETSLSCSTK